MTLFTVQAAGLDDEALAQARFVDDRFSWPAFIFAWAWLLYQRLWLALLVWVVLEIAVLALIAPHISLATLFLLDLLVRLLLGLEASRLQLAKGAKHATFTHLIEARDRDEAEALFYARQRPGEIAV